MNTRELNPSKYAAIRWLAVILILMAVALGLVLVAQATSTQPSMSTVTPSMAERLDGPAPTAVPVPPELPPIDVVQSRQEARSVLRNAFEDTEPAVRLRVLEFVRLANEPDWEARLLERLDDEPDAQVQAWMAVTLSAIGSSEVRARVRALHRAIDRRTEPVLHVWYEYALALLGDGRAARRLYRAADSKNLEVSVNASLLLVELSKPGDHNAIRRLQKLARRERELIDHDRYAGLTILAGLVKLGHKPARDQLRAHLGNRDEGVRLHSARLLAELGDDAGRPVLLDIFNDGASNRRILAAAALVILGDYDGAGTLQACVRDERAQERKLCVAALSTIGDIDHVRDLIPLYRAADRVVSVAAAASVLFILGLQPRVLARESIDWVRTAMQSDDWTVRRAATVVTASLSPEVAVPLLAEAVVDDSAEVRKEAVRVLGRMKNDDAARVVAAAAENEDDPAVKKAQVEAMARIGSPVAAGTLLSLSNTRDPLGTLATGAYIAVLDESADAALVAEANDRLATSYKRGRTNIRQAVMESAMLADNRIVVPTLQLGLSDRVFDIRMAAAEGLAHYREFSEEVTRVLTRATKKSAELSARATAALVKLGVVVEPRTAIESIMERPEAEIRLTAFDLIADLRWHEIRSLVPQALADNAPTVRQKGIEVIDIFADEHPDDAVHLLKTVLRDPDLATRMKAKARLAELLPRAASKSKSLTGQVGASSPGYANKLDLAALRVTAARARTAHVDLEQYRRAVSARVGAIGKHTARAARNSSDVDRAKELGEAAKKAHRVLVASYGEVGNALLEVNRVALSLPGDAPEVVAILAEVSGWRESANQILDESRLLIARAQDKVEDFVDSWQVDKDLCIDSAETNISDGELSDARRDLECAEQMYAKRKDYNPRLHYVWGRYYDELAQLTKNPRTRERRERKAVERYDRYIELGQGYQVARARERRTAIAESAQRDDKKGGS